MHACMPATCRTQVAASHMTALHLTPEQRENANALFGGERDGLGAAGASYNPIQQAAARLVASCWRTLADSQPAIVIACSVLSACRSRMLSHATKALSSSRAAGSNQSAHNGLHTRTVILLNLVQHDPHLHAFLTRRPGPCATCGLRSSLAVHGRLCVW